jgi:hypothetical protein
LINPFTYGKIVSGDNFADREKETKQLFEDLKSGQNVLLYSPRRYGKTSLIFRVLDQLKKDGLVTAYIDVYGCLTVPDFIDKIIQETVVPSQGSLQRIGDFLREQISGLSPEVTLNSDGSISVSFKKEAIAQGTEKVLAKIIDAPQKLAEAKKKRLVVAFDEFQEITTMDGLSLEKTVRSSFQRHKDVTYLFAGSKQHIMTEMFGQERRPFYKFAKPFPLERIPLPEFSAFITSKFKATNISIRPEIVQSILDFTEGHPYLTQQLCHELWSMSTERKKVAQEDIAVALNTILSQHGDYFSGIWDSLSSGQKRLLLAIAKEVQVKNISSVDFVAKHALISASHIMKSLHSLEKGSLVEHSDGVYFIEDVLFREWIRANMCSCETATFK